MKQTFVFVVCGAKEHIDTLNFSLKALRRYSELPILVVTDLKRNEAAIDHPSENIIDVRVAAEYDHHQASIYLKTGLHRFLPMEDGLYCYLDTDVVALNADVAKIFNEYASPITFATDHCRMNQFSGHAVNCGCFMPKELKERIDYYRNQYAHLRENESTINRLIEEWVKFKSQFPLEQAKNDWFNGLLEGRPDLVAKRARLMTLTDTGLPLPQLVFNYVFRVFPHYRRSIASKRWSDTEGNVLLDQGKDYYSYMNKKGFFSSTESNGWMDRDGIACPEIPKTFETFFADKGIKYRHSDEAWYTREGELFWPNLSKLVEQEGLYWYDRSTDVWFDVQDRPVSLKECNHLQKAISDDFSIDVKNPAWQHWNGGVFLFDSESMGFLDTWHQLTLEAFSLPYWKTRDQGTLIATAWKYGLQNHASLPVEFNFIADYYHPTITYEGNLAFRFKVTEPLVLPSFIHIYHHWGDKSWNVWNDVENQVLEQL